MTADFKCDECGSIIEDDIKNSPICCDKTMRRVFSKICLSFKGKGFYVNDYPKKAKK